MYFYFIVFGILAAFGVLVAWALGWAVRHRQFESLDEAALSIFDDDEREQARWRRREAVKRNRGSGAHR
ncbi:MAG: cbb3-type cytochrome oxidase assembly protein [Phycisphaeraceae bacterium]|nr:cbb3-type cytochrome oxidase assembly protein [Phycisphaeraceae bacterium]